MTPGAATSTDVRSEVGASEGKIQKRLLKYVVDERMPSTSHFVVAT